MLLAKRTLFMLVALLLLAPAAQAQMRPDKSPRCQLHQTIGLTNFTLDFSRPSMRDREIFGGLLPYGELWRTGANMASTIEFDQPITLMGERLSAGKYSIFTIPGKTEWTFILNKDWNQGGTRNYDKKMDVFRKTVKAVKVPKTETMMLNLVDFHSEGATLELRWEETALHLPIKVEVRPLVEEAIEEKVGDIWYTLASAGRYYLDEGYKYETALEMFDKSIAIEPNYYNHYFKAQLLRKMGKEAEAKTTAEKALELGNADPSGSWDDYWKPTIQKFLDEA